MQKHWLTRLQTIISGMLIVGLILAGSGCEGPAVRPEWEQVKQLQQEKTVLEQQVQDLRSENKALTQQVETLSSLGREVRLEALPELAKIEITKRSGLYDKDKDGKKEKLIVYVRPFDKTGDTIKASGTVSVQLWDLGAGAADALVGQWEITPVELTKLWSGTMLTNYYRLTFDVSGMEAVEEKELTVKVTFADYITGRVLGDQKVIQP